MSTEQLAGKYNQYLIEVYSTLENMGDARFARRKQNQFGEIALAADIEAEAVIIKNLRALSAPVRIVSEEHGALDLVDKPKLLVVIDGLDGSTLYEKNKGDTRAGTMVAVFDGIDPLYNDYLYCGIIEHKTARLLYATYGEGCRLLELKSGETTEVHSSQTAHLDRNTRMYLDFPYPGTDKLFAKILKRFKPMLAESTAAAYLDVATGVADLNLESTRKGNLEAAAAFGLINESGGVIVDSKGESLGSRKYFEYGQFHQLPVIAASTLKLAQEAVNQL